MSHLRSSLLVHGLVGLFVVGAALAFPAHPASASPSPVALLQEDPDQEEEEEESAEEEEQEDEEDGDEKEKKGKPFAETVEEMETIDGLFTLYRNAEENEVLMAIRPEQLDTDYLFSATRESGDNTFFDAGAMLNDFVFQFHKVGKRIQLLQRNTSFQAEEGTPQERAVDNAFPDSIVGATKIESDPHPETGAVLVDPGAFLLKDLHGVGPFFQQLFKRPYRFDKENSYFDTLKSFPDNTEIGTTVHFTANRPAPVWTVPDPRSLLLRYRYSLSTLPETDYRPRVVDDRVGHFLTMYQDHTDTEADDPHVRYVNRWNLQKADPDADLSEPVEPIVFWIENTTPEEYRQAIADGVEMWNVAFEQAGFENAIVAREMPDDAEWDPADVRYNTIRWIVNPGSYAVGPSRTNPYTGQIYDADIRISANYVRFRSKQFREFVRPSAPAGDAGVASSAGSGPSAVAPGTMLHALLGSVAGSLEASPRSSIAGAASPLLRLDPSLLAVVDPTGRWLLDEATWMLDRRAGGSDDDLLSTLSELVKMRAAAAADAGFGSASRLCMDAAVLAQEAAYGWSVLESRGVLESGSVEADEYVHDFLARLVAHEVGHTLGLRHNFKASVIHSPEELQDADAVGGSLTASVMDYHPVNMALPGQEQGAPYWQTEPGPYDRWVVEYAYTELDAESPEAERSELEEIASRVADPRLPYGTDEDAFGYSPFGVDPRTSPYDYSSDPLEWFGGRMALVDAFWDDVVDNFAVPGARYPEIREAFDHGFRDYFLGAMAAAKYVGAIHTHRDHVGDPNGRLPFEPVPAEQQRRAFDFLLKEVFGPDALAFDADLLVRLAPERLWSISGGSVFSPSRLAYPVHDAVLGVQVGALSRIMHPMTLARVADLPLYVDDAGASFGLVDLYDGLEDAVWAEVETPSAGLELNGFRRNVQRAHLSYLVGTLIEPRPGTPPDAVTLARASLTEIRDGIEAALRSGPGDRMTRAHLEESRAVIDRALEASVELKPSG